MFWNCADLDFLIFLTYSAKRVRIKYEAKFENVPKKHPFLVFYHIQLVCSHKRYVFEAVFWRLRSAEVSGRVVPSICPSNAELSSLKCPDDAIETLQRIPYQRLAETSPNASFYRCIQSGNPKPLRNATITTKENITFKKIWKKRKEKHFYSFMLK